MGSETDALILKLDLVARLLSLSLVEGKRQADQITLLSKAGLAPKEIADLLGTTPNTVRVALSNMRKKGPLRVPSRSGESEEQGRGHGR